MKSIKISIIVILLFISAFSMSAMTWLLPRDGETIAVTEIECKDDLEIMPFGVLDLRDAICLSATDRSYINLGDSLIACVDGAEREWFSVKGDSVLSIGLENRFSMLDRAHGLPYLLPMPQAFTADSANSQYCNTISSGLSCAGSYSAWNSGKVIFAPNDTVSVAMGVCTVYADTAYVAEKEYPIVTERTRLYAQDSMFPIVDFRKVASPADTISSCKICPPWEQPLQTRENTSMMMQSRSMAMDGYGTNTDDMHSALFKSPFGTIELLDDEIRFAPPAFETEDRPVSILICDIAGRIIAQSEGKPSIDTTSMAPGTYIVQITTGDSTIAYKIWIE